jgi:alpha-glucosidase (family GH31 glycosyl hydrolase)
LRYALLPYNYTIAYQNSKTGQPLMRPLFFEEPTNTTLFEYSKSYLWGSDFLISPVLESKKTYQEIYFPATGNWFDFYTEEWIQGGTTKSVNLSIENIPTFVREGSFIPMRHGMMNTSEMNSDSIEIHFYYSKNLEESTGVYFNDDGNTSQSYENYSANETHFTFQKRKKTGIISIEKNSIGKIYLKSSFDFYIHQVDKKPKQIKINGKKIKFNYIEKTKILHFKAHSTYSSEEIKIKW